MLCQAHNDASGRSLLENQNETRTNTKRTLATLQKEKQNLIAKASNIHMAAHDTTRINLTALVPWGFRTAWGCPARPGSTCRRALRRWSAAGRACPL